MYKNSLDYTAFIKGALAVGFTDAQADFLWEWISIGWEEEDYE